MKVPKKAVMAIIAIVVVLSLGAAAWLTPAMKQRHSSAAKNTIAVIYVDGLIVGGRGQTTLLSEYGGTDNLIKELHEARDDASVQAVVLRINSPGGSTPATQEVAEEIKKIRDAGKILVASMGDVAASGGYWLAATTDKIYANPSTITGSIGVYMPYANWQELYKKIGIHQEKIKSGPHKDILSPERDMTPEERAIIQTMVDDIYNQFVAVVASGRNMDPAKVRQLADGRVYTGNQALQLGLVDEMGNLYDAIEGTAQLAGIQGEPVIKEYGKNSPWSMIFGANPQLDPAKILQQESGYPLPITAPLALPDRL